MKYLGSILICVFLLNKLLGKTELENLSNDISNEAEKYKCTEFKLLSKFLTYKSLRSFSKFIREICYFQKLAYILNKTFAIKLSYPIIF